MHHWILGWLQVGLAVPDGVPTLAPAAEAGWDGFCDNCHSDIGNGLANKDQAEGDHWLQLQLDALLDCLPPACACSIGGEL